MDLNNAKKLFHELYKDIDGYELSTKAQSKLPYFYNAHYYGEIDFDSFYKIISLTKSQQNEIFYDLGSGIGKAAVLASLCFPFKKCIGVEILYDLHEAAYKVSKQLNAQNIEFILGNFNDFDFSNGDVIFLNSVYFHYEMINENFLKKLESLKKGTRLIFVEPPIQLSFLEQIHHGQYMFSWGLAEVFVFIKI